MEGMEGWNHFCIRTTGKIQTENSNHVIILTKNCVSNLIWMPLPPPFCYKNSILNTVFIYWISFLLGWPLYEVFWDTFRPQTPNCANCLRYREVLSEIVNRHKPIFYSCIYFKEAKFDILLIFFNQLTPFRPCGRKLSQKTSYGGHPIAQSFYKYTKWKLNDYY